jgi:hypothetical protein
MKHNYQLPTTKHLFLKIKSKLKSIVIFLVLFISTNKIFSQGKQDFNLTPNGILENVFDNYGTKYKLEDLLVNPLNKPSTNVPVNPCSTNYFNLFFDVGSGMEDVTNPIHNARRAVVCKVFQDLSNYINSPSTTTIKLIKN